MRKVKIWIAICAVVCFLFGAKTTFAAATDVTGNWTADMTTPDGNSFALTFVFKQDGTKLTGTVQGPEGDPLAIDNGKVDGDHITFTVSFNGTTFSHDGTVSGDEIKMTTKSDNGDFPGGEMTLKRTKQ
ncbi:MAG TPA: hypothetical protein VGT04_09985 [Acidobacteriaceae bacterium]|nr:hypothetical protein [Acidobacteriaceae bacterium]